MGPAATTLCCCGKVKADDAGEGGSACALGVAITAVLPPSGRRLGTDRHVLGDAGECVAELGASFTESLPTTTCGSVSGAPTPPSLSEFAFEWSMLLATGAFDRLALESYMFLATGATAAPPNLLVFGLSRLLAIADVAVADVDALDARPSRSRFPALLLRLCTCLAAASTTCISSSSAGIRAGGSAGGVVDDEPALLSDRNRICRAVVGVGVGVGVALSWPFPARLASPGCLLASRRGLLLD